MGDLVIAGNPLSPGARERDPDMPEAIVRVRGLTRTFGNVTALAGIDLDVYEGEFLSFLGPSGCGKTTLLRIIAGFESADAGSVEVDGRDVTRLPPNKRPLNMVFQRYALFPHLTVEGNIAFGLELRRLPRDVVRRRVADALELVRLTHCAKRYPSQVSGGQAQRVALARALVNEPSVLLLDEPLTALDRAVRGELQVQLKRIQAETGTTFIYVTHDQEEAMAMSTRIALMQEGQIVQIARPGVLYKEPSSVFAAGFVGDANILRCDVDEGGDGPAVTFHGMRLAGVEVGGRSGELNVMVRPENVRIAPAVASGARRDGALSGEVVSSTFHGFYWMYRVRCGDDLLGVRETSPTASVALGDEVDLTVEPGSGVPLAD